MKSIYLYPGQLTCVTEPSEISTILGSCVAIALFDPGTGVAGLNHYLLAEQPYGEPASPRYGSTAIPELFDCMLRAGANKTSIRARVFGGGNVLANTSVGVAVGQKNIDYAFATLAKLGIPVISQDVGGHAGRKILFNTSTFEVRHTLMREQDTDVSGHRKIQPVSNAKVLIVDDSLSVRNLFQKMFTKHGLQVVGTAANAFEARDLVVKTKPDAMTLDVEMPGMSGVAFLEKLMKHMPVPTVMVSSLQSDGEAALKALDLGAIEFITKPSQFDPSALAPFAESLVEKVRAAAAMTVVKRVRSSEPATIPSAASVSRRTIGGSEVKLVVVGGNTGSQDSLKAVLRQLAVDTPPVVVANSGLSAFLPLFIERMKKEVSLDLRPAKDGQIVTSGTVYFAEPGTHVSIKKTGLGLVLSVQNGIPVCNQIPSASVLFDSAATQVGGSCVGILLGGYGSDGVDGLAGIRDAGGLTIVENPESAQFPYIPQKAIAVGAAEQVLPAEQISGLILSHRSRKAA